MGGSWKVFEDLVYRAKGPKKGKRLNVASGHD